MIERSTVLPFMTAFFVALAAMGTDVYQICRGQIGTLKIEPWRRARQAVAGGARSVFSALSAIRSWLSDAWPQLAAATLILITCLVWPQHTDASILGGVAIMGRLDDIKAARARVHKDYEAAVDEALKAETPDAKKAAREKATGLKAKFDDLGEDLKLAETSVEQERQIGAAIHRGEQAKDPSQTRAEEEQRRGRVEVGRDLVADDPKRGFKTTREFFRSVMDFGMGRKMDARLGAIYSKGIQAAQGSDEQGEYDNRYGGFFVPHGIMPGVLSVAPEIDPISPLCTRIPMEAPTVSFNARTDKNHSSSVSGGFRVYRRAETVDGTSSRAQFEQVVLTANEEFGVVFATERLLSDSPVSFLGIVQAGMEAEYIANAMSERISGTGTGERQGILRTPCKVSVSKETGQAAATITKENIDKMAARCWRYGRAVWIANHNTRPQLAGLSQTVGMGGAPVAYFTTAGAPAGFDGLLNGRPIVFTEFASTLGTEGDLMLIVPSEYLEGTYQTEQFAESIHVRFVAAERAFRFYRRNDGQWWWKEALTPKNGSTLSPVVTLATRS